MILNKNKLNLERIAVIVSVRREILLQKNCSGVFMMTVLVHLMFFISSGARLRALPAHRLSTPNNVATFAPGYQARFDVIRPFEFP